MERNKYKPELSGAGKGWLALAGFVVAYDVLAPETLSNGFRRGIESENLMIRLGTHALAGVTVAHLYDAIQEGYDPIDGVASGLGKIKDFITDRFSYGQEE